MKKRTQFALVLGIALGVASGPAAAADLAKGKKVFKKCVACHSLVAGKKKIGPSLHGVFGRKAGTLAKFKFSKAMKKAGMDRNLVWNPETLDQYLKKPKKYVPKTKMAFAGLKKPGDRENVIAYIKEATK